MDEIEELFERLNKSQDNDRVRIDIARLIARRMIEVRQTFDDWQKMHFAYSIALLAQNWLWASLVALEKAGVPPGRRSEQYTPRKEQIDSLTFEHLMTDLRKLGG